MDVINNFYRNFFSESLPIKIRIFNIVFIGGTFTGLISLLTAILLPLPIPAIFVSVAITLFMPVVFFAAYLTKKYDVMIVIGLAGINFIFFPGIFLTSGATECGMPCYFLMGIIFTVLLIRNKIYEIIMVTLELFFYCFIFYIPEKWPNLILHLSSENLKYPTIFSNIVIVSFAIGIIGKMLISQFVKDRKNIDKLVGQLEELSIKDSLTGIYNRRYLMDFLTMNISKSFDFGLPLTIIMFDIDNFKSLNDEYGHIIGDKVLKNISAILRNNMRINDIVSRYGGEEFIIVLPNTDSSVAYKRAEQIRSTVENSKLLESTDIKVTISGGIGEYVKGITPHALIDIADKNLYVSKQTGRNIITG